MAPHRMPHRAGSLTHAAIVAVLASVLSAACAAPAGRAGPSPTGTASPASASPTADAPPPTAEVTFTELPSADQGGDPSGRVDMDVIAAPGIGVRVTTGLFADAKDSKPQEVFRLVWDGTKLLSYDSMGDPLYTLYEAPREHPDAWMGMGLWARELMGPDTGTTCHPLGGHRTLLKRDAVGYRCTTAATGQQDAYTADYWFDSDTGVLLENGALKARTFKLAPPTNQQTFSTTPPAGSHTTVLAARKPASGGAVKVPPFSLALLSGGRASSTGYAGHPYVLVFFSSDTYWDSTDACPGCLASLKALQEMSKGGTTPAVLAVQVGSEGKPGLPLVPPGVALKIANEPTPRLQNALGLSNQLAIAFVGPDGMVKATYDHAPTKAELTHGLAAIR